VNSGGAVGAVFRPVGFWDEHAATDRTAFQILIPKNLCFQRPVLRQDRPAEPLTADRDRNGLRTGVGVPIVKDNAVAVFTVTALPPYQGAGLFPLCRGHAVGRAVRPALYGRQAFIWIFYHASLRLFSVAVPPEKASCPIPAACSGVDTLPITSGHFVPMWLLAVLPQPGYSFSDGHSVFKVLSIDELL